jgi:hypothetical protein
MVRGAPTGGLTMFRPCSKVVAAAAVTLLVGVTVACSAFQEDVPVRFVRHAEDAGGCTRVGDVAAAPQLADSQVVGSIANEARKVKADTVVLAQGERKGTAYRCETPQVADKKSADKKS